MAEPRHLIAEVSNCTTTPIFRSEFLWKFLVIQGYGAGVPELGIWPGPGVQNKNQKKPEFCLKFRAGARAMAIWEVAAAPVLFLETNGFAK